MNLANKLTTIRICMIPFFILFMTLQDIYTNILALIIFSVAAITDFLDGRIARKNKIVTSLGIFLDPIADKLLISAAFICFVDIPALGIPAWTVIAIIAREFLITGLRSIAAAKNIIIPADKSGKYKTYVQIVAIILILIILTVHKAHFKFFDTASDTATFNGSFCVTSTLIMKKMPFWITFVVTVFTAYSGINYIRKYRKLLRELNE